MQRKPLSTGNIVGAVVVLVVVPLGLYIGGYVALGIHSEDSLSANGKAANADARIYPKKWQKTIFEPLAKLESFVTNDTVIVYWTGEFGYEPR